MRGQEIEELDAPHSIHRKPRMMSSRDELVASEKRNSLLGRDRFIKFNLVASTHCEPTSHLGKSQTVTGFQHF
jgi:hypothetical protein